MFKNMTYKYCLILLLLAALAGCENAVGPIKETNLKISSISKWKVDTLTGNNLTRILYKEFDRNFYLILQEDFSDKGNIVVKSVYTYESNKSLELKSVFTETGDVKDESKIEYEFDNLRRIIKQTTFTDAGIVNDIHTFQYDLNGNLVKKTKTYSLSGVNSDISINYQYGNNGQLVERVTLDETGDLSRDSIAYNNSLNQVTVFHFNSSGKLFNSIAYIYNKNGNIISEIQRDAKEKIIDKYVYLYTYFKN